MKEFKRPVLSIPRSELERMLEIIAIGGLVFGIFILLQSWSTLPDSIPAHFKFSGEVDRWGSKMELLLLPGLSLILYLGLTILSKYPHIYNYAVEITEENAKRQYHIARTMICWLKTEIVCIFTFIEWKSIQIALKQATASDMKFLTIMVVVVLVTMFYYVLKMFKEK